MAFVSALLFITFTFSRLSRFNTNFNNFTIVPVEKNDYKVHF